MPAATAAISAIAAIHACAVCCVCVTVIATVFAAVTGQAHLGKLKQAECTCAWPVQALICHTISSQARWHPQPYCQQHCCC